MTVKGPYRGRQVEGCRKFILKATNLLLDNHNQTTTKELGDN